MVFVPRMIPMIDNPQVAIALAARWHRARALVLVSMAGLPALIGLVCLTFALLPRLDVSAMPWWSAIPVLAAFLSVIALVAWLRRDGLTDPASWFPATVLMTGSQLVLGVFPGFGIAVRSATGTAVVVKAMLAVGVLSAGSAWSLSRRACRSLLASPVPELGATPLRLVFRGRSSRITIGTDRVDWMIRVSGSRLDAGVSFRNLREVSLTVTSSDGALALVLHTSSGRWTVPTQDAAALCELLRLRKASWEQRVETAIERERELYHEMLHLLATARGTACTADGSVSVTVDADGVATGIELTDGTRGRNPQRLSAELMECFSQARRVVRDEVRDLMVERYAGSVSEKLAA
ncbi:hypothetical protein GCM10022267_35480 [Lentzea roselyniae]|uniref:YbaB/EbfC DNA-binding family protein n=1 Tax=Lentzea roselyniae TaxID=531940 RepID=A0ABP7B2E5_9PSEU